MRVFLRAVLCGILPVSLLLGGLSVSAYTGNAAQTLTDGADIRVMSYNTLVDNDETLGGWSWGKPLADRADKAAAAINYYQPDVIGLQENNYNWHVALRKNLPDYDYVNADVPNRMPLEASESLGKKDWMCTTMMYNTKTLELVANELVGYSVNYWGCIQRMRYISMALFKVKETGETFVFTSTHLDAEQDEKGQGMRRTQAGELADRILYYMDTYGCPIISTGDYNSKYSDQPLSAIREKTGMVSHSNNRGGIDYILYSAGVDAKYFTVVNDADLNGASDHQPIFADLALQDGFSFPTTTPTTTTTTTRPTWTTTAPITAPPLVKPTDAPTTEGTTAVDATTTGVVSDPTKEPDSTTPTLDAPAPTTDVAAGDATTAPDATAPSADAPAADNQPVEAKPVPKRNDVLIYAGIAAVAAAVAVGAGIAIFFLLKMKR